jgi:hypothetical protein
VAAWIDAGLDSSDLDSAADVLFYETVWLTTVLVLFTSSILVVFVSMISI